MATVANSGLSDTSKLVNTVFEAILSNKLSAGTRLSEAALQQELGLGRNVIREAFAKLVAQGILTYEKNKGVKVVFPTQAQTQQIYQARSVIESGVVAVLVEKYAKGEIDLSAMEALIAEEKKLHQTHDSRCIRTSCEFHLRLSELCANQYLTESLRPLIPLSVLATSLYTPADSAFCSFAEHQQLLSAIQTKNTTAARQQMQQHLSNCVNCLDFERELKNKTQLSHIFA